MKSSELSNDGETLVAAFYDVGGVMIEGEVIVQGDTEIFEGVNYFHCLVVDDYGLVRYGMTEGHFFGFIDIEV